MNDFVDFSDSPTLVRDKKSQEVESEFSDSPPLFGMEKQLNQRYINSQSVERAPGDAVEAMKLSRETGERAGVVLENIAESRTAKKVTDLSNASPLTKSLLEGDTTLLTASQDDIGIMSYLETAYKGFTRDMIGTFGGAISGQAGTTQSVLQQPIAYMSAFLDVIGGPKYQEPFEYSTPLRDRTVYKAGEAVTDFGREQFQVPEVMRDGWTDKISGGFGSAAAFFASATIGRGAPIAGGAIGMGSQANEAVQRAYEKGATEDQVREAARIGSMIGLTEQASAEFIVNQLIDRLPAGRFGKLLKPLGRVLIDAAEEGGQEYSQAVLQNILSRWLYDPSQPITEGALEQAIVGAFVGGGMSVPSQMAKARRDRIQLKEMNKAIKKGKADASVYKEQGDAAGQGGSFSIAPENLTHLFQMEGESFEQFRELNPGILNRIDEAQQNNTDVDLSLGDYDSLVKLLPDGEALDFLTDNVRTRHGGMTGAELDEALSDVTPEEDVETGQELYDQVTGQLEDAGVAPDIAADQARVISSFYETAAVRMGLPLEEVIKAVPVPTIVQGELDTASPDVINRRLAREFVDRTPIEAAPADLADFIIEQGGLRPHGDLAAMDADKFRRGIRRITGRRGLGLDAMRELAASAGFPVGESEADFLEAVRSVVAGDKVFPTGTDLSGYEAGQEQQVRNELIKDTLDQVDAVWSEYGPPGPMPEIAKREVINQVLNGVELVDAVAAVAETDLAEAPAVLTQEQQAENLYMVHNLSARNLRHADRMGGLPVPSLAVANVDADAFEGFGEISLIADRRQFDPAASRQNRWFNADIYSPRYPSVTYESDYQEVKDASDELVEKYAAQLEELHGERWRERGAFSQGDIEDGGIDRLQSSTAVQLAYLDDIGAIPDDLDYMSLSRAYGAREGEFAEWVEENFGHLVKGEKIFRGYTPAGNRRYVEHTIDNVVKELRKDLRGGESWNYGVGSIRSAVADELRSIPAIQGQRENIQTSEEVQAFKDDVNLEFEDLASRLFKKTKFAGGEFSFMQDLSEVMQEIPRKGPRALDEIIDDRTEEDTQAVLDFMDKLRQAPTDYFEGKIQRIVGLDEFDTAIVPEGTTESTRKILEDAGLNVVEYKKSEGESRADAIREQSHLLFQKSRGQPRGFIEFDDARNYFKITLTGKANLSTFLHESGHFFLEAMDILAQLPEATPEVRKDFETIREYLEIKPGEKVTTEQHEKWARSFEAYLREGKAPSQELRRAFMRFRSWLVNVYRTLRGLDVELNDDIRQVMDRLLATDEAIGQARAFVAAPDFMPQEGSGLTDEEYARYKEAVISKRTKETEALQNKLMAQYQSRIEKGWKDEVKRVADSLRAEVEKTAGWKAYDALRQADKADKIATSALGKNFPKLPNNVKSKEGSLPDLISQVYGYDQGIQMITGISEAYAAHRAADAQAERIVQQRRGEILTAEQLADEALNLVHNDTMVEIMLTELRGLAREAEVPFSRANMKKVRMQIADEADRVIGSMSARQISPEKYRRAELKSAQEAATARARGDAEAAFLAKRRQLVNAIYYRKARDAKEGIQKIRKYLRPFRTNKKRGWLGKQGPADNPFLYLDQVDALLDAVDFDNESYANLDRKESTREFIDRMVELGQTFAIPEQVLEKLKQTNYREMDYSALQALNDAVKNIDTLARKKEKLKDEKERRDQAEAVGELNQSLEDNWKPRYRSNLYNETDSRRFLMDSWMRFVASSMYKPEFIAQWIDGKSWGGPFSRMIFDPLSEAQTKFQDLKEKTIKPIQEAVENLPDEVKAKWSTEVTFMGMDMTGQEVWMLALNSGNQSNLDRMFGGYGWEGRETEYWATLDSMLTKEEWDAAQAVWDSFEQNLRPELSRLYTQETGLPYPVIEAQEFETRHGTYRGGYFPAKYDTEKSTRAERIEEVKHAKETMRFDLFTPSVNASGVHARVDNFKGYPLRLDPSVIFNHVDEHAHFIAYKEPIRQASNLLNDGRWRKQLKQIAGKEYDRVLRQWLVDIANNRVQNEPDTFITWVSEALRSRASIAAMAWSLKTISKQWLGFGPAVAELGPKYFMNGVKRAYLANPASAQGRAKVLAEWKFAHENSGEIRHMILNRDREIRDVMEKRLGKFRLKAYEQKFGGLVDQGFQVIAMSQKTVNIAVWYGAYEKGVDEGMNHDKARRYADAVMRRTQTASGMKDLSQMQRGGQVARLFFMFMSYPNLVFNRLATVIRNDGWKQPNKIAYEVLWTIMMPVLVAESVGSAVYGALFDDEDYDDYDPWVWLQNIGVNSMLEIFGSVPFVSQAARYNLTPYGFQMSSAESAAKKLLGIPDAMYNILSGEGTFEWKEWEKLLEGSMTAAKVPPKLLTQPADLTRAILGYED